MAIQQDEQELFESQHVHAVYEKIAQDFSRTRHTRWPFVEHFLSALPAGSVVLDSGCGNGKYLGCRSVLPTTDFELGPGGGGATRGKGKARKPEAYFEQAEGKILPVGFDMSLGLLGIAVGKGHEVVRGDCFDMSCWRRGSFDHAISIATIHHFATPARRLEAIKQLILAVIPPTPPTSMALVPQATILVVVWALEQDPALLGVGSARRETKGVVTVPRERLADLETRPFCSPTPSAEVLSSAQDNLATGQDVFVPWFLQPPRHPKPPALSSLPRSQRPPSGTSPSPLPPAQAPTTFNRYYHLFRNGELSALVNEAADELKMSVGSWDLTVQIMDNGERWERENWVVRIGVSWKRSS